MRHNKKFNHLGRTAAHRKALLSNLSAALIMEKRIFTTLAKAKALRKHIEPIITRSKTNSGHNRRQVFSRLQNAEAVTELFEKIADKVRERPGGYIRIIRTDFGKAIMLKCVWLNSSTLTRFISKRKKLKTNLNDDDAEEAAPKGTTETTTATSSEGSQTEESEPSTDDSTPEEDSKN